MADLQKIQFNNRTILTPSRDSFVAFTEIVPVIPYITIGNQIWTSPILNIDDGGSGILKYNSYIVNNVDLGPVYFYTYDAALRIANATTGWHLPTKSEVDTMVNYINGGYNSTVATKLKATIVWSNPGTDNYGFGALPYGFIKGTTITNAGTESTFWQTGYYRMYILNNNTIVNGTETNTTVHYPLRLIKD